MQNGPEFASEQFRKGMEVRREVLGAAYVDQSMANADAFRAPLQKLITEWCWGEIWTRPGLSHKVRSMINLAMLTALNRPNEIRIHARGALANGVTREEIQEILLQTAVYCGVPAALDSFKVVAEVFKEVDAAANGPTGQ